MSRPSIGVYVEKVLNEWKGVDEFTALEFANQFNNRYGHFSISSSGFYTFFLKLEKEGKLIILRSDNTKKNRYRKVIKDESSHK